MIKYIFCKMSDRKIETIGNVVLYICMISMISVCSCLLDKIQQIINNENYKSGVETVNIVDPFIREKMDAIFVIMICVAVVISIVFVIIFVLKIRLDVIKERYIISLYQIIGYGVIRRVNAIYTGKIIELLLSTVFSYFIANGVWGYLCNQKMFKELFSMLDKNLDFNIWYTGLIVCIFAILSWLTIFVLLYKKSDIMKGLKGDTSE